MFRKPGKNKSRAVRECRFSHSTGCAISVRREHGKNGFCACSCDKYATFDLKTRCVAKHAHPEKIILLSCFSRHDLQRLTTQHSLSLSPCRTLSANDSEMFQKQQTVGSKEKVQEIQKPFWFVL